MDIIALYTLFCLSLGSLITSLFWWLLTKSMSPKTSYRYDIHDEIDMILETCDF